METGPYVYVPLDTAKEEFRIFDLEQGRPDEQIRGTLRIVSMLSEPKPFYETISYVWGDASNMVTVHLDGMLLTVPSSADEVLRRMRSEYWTKPLWIDSICIDQSNADERSSQVTMMGCIYRATFKNLIWLGQATTTTASGFAGAESLALEADARFGPSADLVEVLVDRQGPWKEDSMGFPLDFSLEPFVQVLQSPWFERLWTFQEAVLPANSVCIKGLFKIPLPRLTRGAVMFVYKRSHLSDTQLSQSGEWMNPVIKLHFQMHCAAVSSSHPNLDPFGITRLLVTARDLQCSNPKDKVFAWQGLRPPLRKPAWASLLEVGYHKTLSEIYSNATRAAIEQSGSLTVLASVGHKSDPSIQYMALPSWVPDWSQTYSTQFDASSLGQNVPKAWLLTARISQAPPHDVLAVSGLKLDIVRSMSRHIPLQEIGNVGAELCRTCSAFLAHKFNAAEIETICGHTLTALAPGDSIQGAKVTESFVRWASGCERPSDSANSFGGRVRSTCQNRRIFVTREGSLGLGPHTMEENDVVAFLYGLKWMAVLRSRDKGYTFVGVCYVYDVAFGGALDKLKAAGKENEVFYLH